LPDLPVAVEVGEIRVSRIDLGEDILGQSASLAVNGALTLADGTLSSKLEIARLDKPGDRLSLMAGYVSSTRQIDLDLTLSESADGLIATALDLPGRPNMQLVAKGSGPVSDFAAEIGLSSNGQDRLGAERIHGKPTLDQRKAIPIQLCLIKDQPYAVVIRHGQALYRSLGR
jgi:translocation and assembly module TamB